MRGPRADFGVAEANTRLGGYGGPRAGGPRARLRILESPRHTPGSGPTGAHELETHELEAHEHALRILESPCRTPGLGPTVTHELGAHELEVHELGAHELAYGFWSRQDAPRMAPGSQRIVSDLHQDSLRTL